MLAQEFFNLEKALIKSGLDSDLDSFDVIKKRLSKKEKFTPDEFARQAIYVVMASGFSQKTAKQVHKKIMTALANGEQDLMAIFNNKNKTSAAQKLWDNKKQYRDEYYKLSTIDDKLKYLESLPHIGKITANHLARNLGENVFKRDVWIDRLLKKYGEDLFEKLESNTKLPRGYIDVVLWKSCQNGLIDL
jgi:endonuclease III